MGSFFVLVRQILPFFKPLGGGVPASKLVSLRQIMSIFYFAQNPNWEKCYKNGAEHWTPWENFSAVKSKKIRKGFSNIVTPKILTPNIIIPNIVTP